MKQYAEECIRAGRFPLDQWANIKEYLVHPTTQAAEVLLKNEDEEIAKMRINICETFHAIYQGDIDVEIRVGSKFEQTKLGSLILLLSLDRLTMLSSLPAILTCVFVSQMELSVQVAINNMTPDSTKVNTFEDVLANVMADTFNDQINHHT